MLRRADAANRLHRLAGLSGRPLAYLVPLRFKKPCVAPPRCGPVIKDLTERKVQLSW